jgi:hypothetical protein
MDCRIGEYLKGRIQAHLIARTFLDDPGGLGKMYSVLIGHASARPEQMANMEHGAYVYYA